MSYYGNPRNLDTFNDGYADAEIVFIVGDEEVLILSAEQTFPGEVRETRDLLAAERGISPDAITVRIR